MSATCSTPADSKPLNATAAASLIASPYSCHAFRLLSSEIQRTPPVSSARDVTRTLLLNHTQRYKCHHHSGQQCIPVDNGDASPTTVDAESSRSLSGFRLAQSRTDSNVTNVAIQDSRRDVYVFSTLRADRLHDIPCGRNPMKHCSDLSTRPGMRGHAACTLRITTRVACRVFCYPLGWSPTCTMDDGNLVSANPLFRKPHVSQTRSSQSQSFANPIPQPAFSQADSRKPDSCDRDLRKRISCNPH